MRSDYLWIMGWFHLHYSTKPGGSSESLSSLQLESLVLLRSWTLKPLSFLHSPLLTINCLWSSNLFYSFVVMHENNGIAVLIIFVYVEGVEGDKGRKTQCLNKGRIEKLS